MIYFDSAATTLQKPPAVALAVASAVSGCASPGRGDHPASQRADEVMFACRSALSELFGGAGPEQVVFTQNATHALNLAIRSTVGPGDTVLISAWEHNAVTRTLASIPGVQVQVARAPLFDDLATLDAFREGLNERPAAVICTCVSNVYGYQLPIPMIAALCRQAGVPLILDAAQAAGCVPLSLSELGAAFLAMPGHKGLYGPQGTGALITAPDAPKLVPVLTGGTGSESRKQEMPDFLPDRGEAGTQNVAGVAGLLEGVSFVRNVQVPRIAAHEKALVDQLRVGLECVEGVHGLFSPCGNQAGVVSLVVPGEDCQELATRLGELGVAVRGGLHCAPLAHQSGGTLETGTLRVSFSAFNQPSEVDAFLQILDACLRTGRAG